jgi:hypothetical protein
MSVKAKAKEAEKAPVKAETPKAPVKKAKELSKVQNQLIVLMKRPKGATVAEMMKETGLEYRKIYMQCLNWMKFGHPVKKLDKGTFQYK